MAAEIHYRYDDELGKRAARRLLSRNSRLIVSILIALLVTALGALTRSWWLVSAFGALTIMYAAMAVRQRRGARAAFNLLGNPDVTLRVDDKGMTFIMPGYQASAEWTAQREIWQFEDIWIFRLFGTMSAYTPVPTAAMTGEFREIVLAGMRAHGGRVR